MEQAPVEVQNCDDQRATQIHIHIDEKSIVSFNDGRSLSWGQDEHGWKIRRLSRG